MKAIDIDGNEKRFAWKVWLKRFFWAVAVFLVLVVVLSNLFAYLNHRKLKAELAQLAASGAPVTGQDLRGEPVPEESNAVTWYERAVRELDLSGTEEKALADFLVTVSRGRLGTPPESVVKVVKRNASVLELASRGARCKQAQFNLNWDNLMSSDISDMKEFRRLARLAAAASALAALKHDSERALEYWRTTLAIGTACLHSRTIIGALVGMAIHSLAFNALETCLLACNPSPGALQSCYDELEQINYASGLVEGLQGECISVLQAFEGIAKGEIPDASGKRRMRPIGLFLWLVRSDERFYLHMIQARIQALQAYAAQPSPRNFQQLTALADKPVRVHWYRVFSTLLLPSYNKLTTVLSKHEALLAEAKAAIAVKSYIERTGKVPATVKEALPQGVSLYYPSTGEAIPLERKAGYLLIGKPGETDSSSTPPFQFKLSLPAS